MKNTFLFLAVYTGLMSCTESGSTKKKEEYTLAEAEGTLNADSATGSNLTAVAHQPQIDTNANKIGTAPTGGAVAKGAQLMEGNDCASCHRVNEKLLGPAYQDVAKRYPSTQANVSMLAKKIISGGQGNWGDIAMTPHPALSVADAEEMARYILSLK